MKVTGNKYKRMLPTGYPKSLVSPEGCGTLYSMLISFIQTLSVSPHLLTWLHSTFALLALLPLSHLSTPPLQQILSLHFFSSSNLLLNLVPSIHSALTLLTLCGTNHPFPHLYVPFGLQSLKGVTSALWRNQCNGAECGGAKRWDVGRRWEQDKGRVMERRGTGAEYSKMQCYQAKALGNTVINNVWRWVLFAGCFKYVTNWRDDLGSRFVTLLTAGSHLAGRTGTLASPWVTLTFTTCTEQGAVLPVSVFRASWRKHSLLLNTLSIQCQFSFLT